MKYTIEWSENKAVDWTIATLKDEHGIEYPNVSINRTSKKGEVMPKFDEIKTGGEIEGELWTSQSNKHYLFPPRLETAKPPQRSAGAVAKMMEKKSESIKVAQDNKERGIMTSSTMRMAVDIALAETHGLPFDIGVFKSRVKEWRNWLIAEWGDLEQTVPFND